MIEAEELKRLRNCIDPEVSSLSAYSWTNNISIHKDVVAELLSAYDYWQSILKMQPRGAIPEDPIDVQKQCIENMAKSEEAVDKILNSIQQAVDGGYTDGKQDGLYDIRDSEKGTD